MKYLFFIATITAIVCNSLYAQPGTVDSNFGVNGTSAYEYAIRQGSVEDIAIDKKGRIYAITKEILIYRTLKNGSLDTTFGDSGKLIFPYIYTVTHVSINIFSNQKILITFVAPVPGVGAINHIRLLDDGIIDSSFGVNGMVSYKNPNFSHSISDTEIQKDDKILCIGTDPGGESASSTVVFRFNSNGELDSSFAEHGVFRKNFVFETEAGIEIEEIDKGGIMLCISGGRYFESLYFIAVKLSSSGIIDSSFGRNGFVATNVGKNCNDGAYCSFVKCMAVDKKGRILIGGDLLENDTNLRTLVVRYLPNGKIDRIFAQDGFLEYEFVRNSNNRINNILHDSFDNIILSGSSFDNDNINKNLVVRLTENGTRDSSFNGTSYNFEVISGNLCAAIQENNNIITGGGEYPKKSILVQYNGTKTIRYKIIVWIRRNTLHFSDDNGGTASYYIVEQQSSGGGFMPVARIASNNSNNYSYDISNHTLSTTSTNYRIKAIYADGAAAYSDAITASALQTDSKVSISPNPASSIINISFKENKWQDGTIYLYDAMGNLVRSQSFAKQTKISINISNLRQGHYRVVVNRNGVITEGNFLKE